MNLKQIHFYESDEEFYLDMRNSEGLIHKYFYLGYMETEEAIYNDETMIHTLQMCCLDTSLFRLGYRIFIHEESGDVYEVKLGTDNERTNRELKEGHNIFKMWLSGEFEKDV